MKYLKMLSLAAIAAGALMVFAGAGTASATELTCTNPLGTKVMCPVGTVITAMSEGHAVLDSVIGNIECTGEVSGKTTTTGGPEETVKGNIESLSFTGCTNNAVVNVLAKGSLEIHTDPLDPTGSSGKTGNGTLTSTGTEVTVEQFGFHCIFKTNGTDIGTLTGASTATIEIENEKGEKEKVFTHMATFDINATIPRTGGRSGAFCGSSAPWTGSYTVTNAGSVEGNNGWLDVDHHEA